MIQDSYRLASMTVHFGDPVRISTGSEEWLRDLKSALEVFGNGYMRAVGNGTRAAADDQPDEPISVWPALRPTPSAFAAGAVGTVLNALGKLPGMEGHVGLVPFHDLVAALLDLGDGGQPPLLQPTLGVGSGRQLTGRRFVREHAILSVMVLERCGMKGNLACEKVAAALAETGHTGRKRVDKLPVPISSRTVSGWRSDARKPGLKKRDPRMAAFFERQLAQLERDPSWPFSPDLAERRVTEYLSSNILRSKI
jgi:hypothetical protein